MNERYIFFVFIVGTVLITLLAISIGIFLIGHKRRQEKNRIERLETELNHRNELLRTRLEEQEASMSIISSEIHDNVGQILSVVKMYLTNIHERLQTEEERQLMDKTKSMLSGAIKDLRSISHSLNSELMQETGLIASIERELNNIEETTDIRARFDINGEPYNIEKERNLLVFRIVQEAVQNIIKHARSTEILIVLSYASDFILLEVSDNGLGFDMFKAEQNETLGMRNMKNRAKLLGADLSITSALEEGTKISLKITKTKKL